MKLGKRIPFHIADAGADTRLGTGSLFKGATTSVVGLLDLVVSGIVNTLGIVLTLFTIFTGFFLRSPMMIFFMAVFGAIGFVVLQNSSWLMVGEKTNLTERQLRVDWPNVRRDLTRYFDVATNKVINFDYSDIPYPEIKFHKLGSLTNNPEATPEPESQGSSLSSYRFVPASFPKQERGNANAKSANAGSWYRKSATDGAIVEHTSNYKSSNSIAPAAQQRQQYNYRPPVQVYRQPPPQEYLAPSRRSSPYSQSYNQRSTFAVYKNAYHTARTNNLRFRPSSNVDQTLRDCRFVAKGSSVHYDLDIDGYVSGCRIIQ